jgi:hypothetical protein
MVKNDSRPTAYEVEKYAFSYTNSIRNVGMHTEQSANVCVMGTYTEDENNVVTWFQVRTNFITLKPLAD